MLLSSEDNKPTKIFFHPVWTVDGTKILKQETLAIFEATLKQNSNERLKSILFRTFDVEDLVGGVTVFLERKRNLGHVFFQKRFGAKLELMSDDTPEDLGIKSMNKATMGSHEE